MSDQRPTDGRRGESEGGATNPVKRRGSRSSSSSSRSSSSDRSKSPERQRHKHKKGNKGDGKRYTDSDKREKGGHLTDGKRGSSSSSDGEKNESNGKKVSIDSSSKKPQSKNSNPRQDHRKGSASPYRTYNSRATTATGNRNRNNYNSNKNSSNNRNSNNNSNNDSRRRPATSQARLESTASTLPATIYSPRGYDNSDRNPDRINIGSSTDQVADQRPIFGPWNKPDPEKQRMLVERLAPAKAPAPQDPRFNHWKNHFRYYWTIGIDEKPRRPGIYGQSPRSARHSAYNNNDNDQRLLRRPKTTSGRPLHDNNNGSGGSSNNSSSSSNGGDMNNSTIESAYSSSRHGRGNNRGSQSARDWGSSDNRYVSGLDRRYMGLQAVSSTEMEEIVQRLTKMTSAYHAKFAPNPHVWVDNEPGAHMVKRQHTTVG